MKKGAHDTPRSAARDGARLVASCVLGCVLLNCGRSPRESDDTLEPGANVAAAPAPRALRLLHESPEGGQDEGLARLELPATLPAAGWRVEGGDGSAEPRAEIRAHELGQVLHIDAAGELDVFAAFDGTLLERADHVALTVETEEDLVLRVTLRAGEQILWISPERRYVNGAPNPQRLRVALPATDAFEGVADTLVVTARGVRAAWSLAAPELAAYASENRLGRLDEPAQLLEVDGDWRRGLGLARDKPLRGRVQVEAGARLAFSYGWPKALQQRRPPMAVHLQIRSDAEQGIRRHKFELPTLEEPRGWRQIDVPLPPGNVDVRVQLKGRGPYDAVVAMTEPRVYTPAHKPQTVLLITSDTHRGDHLGAAKSTVPVRTPAIDRLAERGVYFEDCFSSSDVTIPSHVAILSGLHPRDSGILDNYGRLAGEATTLAEAFADAGYATFAAVSVRHLGPSSSGLGQGFERMVWPQGQSTATQTIDVLERWLPDAEQQPLFVWLHLFDAHGPYEPRAPWDRVYYPEGADPRDPSLPEPDFPPPDGMDGVRDAAWITAQYRGEISFLDNQLSRVLRLPRVRHGVVALTGDHGESLGQHDIFWGHVSVYPDTLHVPLILAFPPELAPQTPPGMRVATPVSHLGLGRTLLDLAGLQEQPFGGRNLLRETEVLAAEPRYAIASVGRSASITVGKWHLVLHLQRYARNLDRYTDDDRFAGLFFERHATELYDLEADRATEHDLATAEPDRTARMRALLIDWLQGPPGEGFQRRGVMTGELEELLSELGYTGGSEELREASSLIDPDCECERCAAFR